jgi:hypothetical protein
MRMHDAVLWTISALGSTVLDAKNFRALLVSPPISLTRA